MANGGRFLRPYYLVHLLVLLSYPPARLWAINFRGLRGGFVQTAAEGTLLHKPALLRLNAHTKTRTGTRALILDTLMRLH